MPYDDKEHLDAINEIQNTLRDTTVNIAEWLHNKTLGIDTITYGTCGTLQEIVIVMDLPKRHNYTHIYINVISETLEIIRGCTEPKQLYRTYFKDCNNRLRELLAPFYEDPHKFSKGLCPIKNHIYKEPTAEETQLMEELFPEEEEIPDPIPPNLKDN